MVLTARVIDPADGADTNHLQNRWTPTFYLIFLISVRTAPNLPFRKPDVTLCSPK
jgi:hypothetical protein